LDQPKVQQEIARTQNPLLNANKASKAKVPPPKEGKQAAAAVDEKKSYVPPPPAESKKLPHPAGMPKVKEFPVSAGPPPTIMSFPNIKSAEPSAPAN